MVGAAIFVSRSSTSKLSNFLYALKSNQLPIQCDEAGDIILTLLSLIRNGEFPNHSLTYIAPLFTI